MASFFMVKAHIQAAGTSNAGMLDKRKNLSKMCRCSGLWENQRCECDHAPGTLIRTLCMRIVGLKSTSNRTPCAAQDIRGTPGAGSSALEGATVQQVADAKKAARAAADALVLTDAPLLFPPGQLALAAMRSGFNKVGLLNLPGMLLQNSCPNCNP